MKAMILAAGRGERMRPLTDQLPKPMLLAGGKPLIVWQLERLARAGIREIVINHAWLGERLVAALGNGSAWGLRIAWSAEVEALETAGGIAQALPLLAAGLPPARAATQPFLVVNGDTWSDFDYGRAHTIALQMRHAGLASWCVMVRNPPHHPKGDFGLADGRLRLESSDAAGSLLTYAGIGLYTPTVFQGIGAGARAPLRPCLEQAIAAGRAGGEYHAGSWFDIGTPQRLADLDRLIATGTAHAEN